MPSRNARNAAPTNAIVNAEDVTRANITVEDVRMYTQNAPTPSSPQELKAVREYSYGRQRAKRAAERARTQDIKAKGSFILPSPHRHAHIPPRGNAGVNAYSGVGSGVGFGWKLGLSAALTRSRVATIADNVRREREDEKSMLDVLLKEDRVAGIELDYGAMQSEWPSLTAGTCEVRLEDLVRPKKPRKNKAGDFEVVPPIRGVVALDNDDFDDLGTDFEEPWEYVSSDEADEKAPSYAEILAGTK